MYVYMYAYMYVYICMYIYVYIYICVNIYIYINSEQYYFIFHAEKKIGQDDRRKTRQGGAKVL